MTIFKQKFFRPGRFNLGPFSREYTQDEVREYASCTNQAIAAGLSVPVFGHHAAPGIDAGGPQAERRRAVDAVGWLRGVNVTADGWLEHEIDVTDPAHAKKARQGSIRFVSPEFRENWKDGLGRTWKKIIAHLAFTAMPRNPDQGPMVAMQFDEHGQAVSAVQLSLDDLEEEDDDMDPEKDKDKAADTDTADKDENSGGNPFETDGGTDIGTETPPPAENKEPDNPDIIEPVSGKDAAKEQAVVAGFAQIGLQLPSDFKLNSDGALDILLAAIKTKAAADQEAEAEAEVPTPESPTVGSSPMSAQFSMEQIKTVPGLKELIAERDQLAAEKRAGELRKALSGLPPALKDHLSATVAQFDGEGRGEKTYTTIEVAEMVKKFLPPVVAQFGSEEMEEEKFFDRDDKVEEEVADQDQKLEESNLMKKAEVFV